MTEIERSIELKIAELKLKPGAKLAIICPEDWTPNIIQGFQRYMDEMFKSRGYDFELLCFPHGVELAVITPAGGSTDAESES